MKNYLHRQIKIPQFFFPGELKNSKHDFKLFYLFLIMHHQQAESRI